MNVTYAPIDNVNGEITVVIEEKDYTDKVEKQLKEISKHRPEPGFRPGKTPMGLLRKKYGDAVKYDIINKEVGDAVYDYIRNENLHVLGNPMPVKMEEEFNLENKDFTFRFKVGVAPEIDTHVNKDLHVPFYNITVSDEMIGNEDEQLRKRFGKQVPGEAVEPNALVKGVITELDENGEPKAEGIVVENGILAPSYFKNKDQEALFDGKKVGETVVFNPDATCDGNEAELSSMLNIDKADAAAHHGDFKMEIKEIIVVQPAELNEEYFENLFGKDKVHNEEEYRNAIKEMIANALGHDSFYRFTIDAKQGVLDAVGEIELPEPVLKEYLMQREEKITPENVDEAFASMRPQLVWDLVAEAIARQFEVKVEQSDLMSLAMATVQQQLAQYGMANAPKEMVEKYAQEILKDEKNVQRLAQQSMDFKVFNAIKENVSLDEKDVNVEEFRTLFASEVGEEAAAE